jgi:hypothetical protein
MVISAMGSRIGRVKYMLMIYGKPETWDSWSEEDNQRVIAAHKELVADITASGELIGTAGLTTVNARSVRVHDGVPAVTDGPFTEAKEVLAGYYLVECDSIERATEIAARVPEAAYDPIEVREVMEDPLS